MATTETAIPLLLTTTYLVKLNPAGTTVSYASYLGGSNASSPFGPDFATALALDSSGSAYLTGRATSPNFPTTTGAYQTAFPANGGSSTAFVAKINTSMSGAKSLVYSSLLGDQNTTEYAIAVDGTGDAYVTGFAEDNSNTFPITQGAFSYSGVGSSYDPGVYVTKFNPTGSALVYSAYLGYGQGHGIAVDGSGNAYVTGEVEVEDFPTTSGAYQTSYPGGFVTELNPAGSAEIYSTFLSGPNGGQSPTNTVPYDLAIPPGCVSVCPVYIAGLDSSAAGDFPQVNSIQTTPASTSDQGFAVELNGTGSAAVFSTYLSGIASQTDTNNPSYALNLAGTPSIAVDKSGNVFFSANITASDFPVTTTAGPTGYSPYLAKIGPATGGIVVGAPTALNLGTTTVGTSSVVTAVNTYPYTFPTVTLRNMGITAVTLSSITASSSTFAQTNTCGGSIAAGGQCILTPAFTPTTSGAVTGTLTVNSSGNGSPFTISLSGTGSDGVYFQATPTAAINFGTQTVGTAGGYRTITVKNTGDQAGNAPYISNPQPGFNSLTNCPATVNAGASCEIGVQFAPYQAGLLSGSFSVYSSSYGTVANIPYSGTGVVSGDVGSVALNATALNFNTVAIGQSSNQQTVTVTNTSDVPVTINQATVALTSGIGLVTDFAASITYNQYNGECNVASPQITPGSSCSFYVYFTPSVAGTETATLSIPTSAGTQTVALSGVGAADTQDLVFAPANYVFPNQPIGTSSSIEYFTVYDSGDVPVFFDRVYATGDFTISSTAYQYSFCAGETLNPPSDSGLAPPSACQVSVTFTPTASGTRTGTVTFVDSASGTAQVLALTGTGITPTGALQQSATSLTFPTAGIGVASPAQSVDFSNSGNTPVAINSVTTTGDYSYGQIYLYENGSPYEGCNPGSCSVPVGGTFPLVIPVVFTPSSATNPRSGTLTVNTSAGVYTVSLSGTGEAATQSVAFTPSLTTTVNFGSVVTGQTTYVPIFMHNTGTAAVTIPSTPTFSGSYSLAPEYGNTCGYSSQTTLQPDAECYVYVTFAPTKTGAQTGTIVFTDSAGTQTVNLTGTGVSAAPTTYFSQPFYTYQQTGVGNTNNFLNNSNSYGYLYFYNQTTNPLTISSVTFTGSGAAAFGDYPFEDSCTNSSVGSNGGNCQMFIYFAPQAAGYYTATLTLTDSTGKTYTAPLYGYSPAIVDTGYLTPEGLAFGGQTINTASAAQTIQLYNSGNTLMTIAQVTGTNLGSSSEFQVTSDACSNVVNQGDTSCSVSVEFVPSGTGVRSGTISFPVTYSDGTTATLTANLTGTGIAASDQAILTPTSAQFQATAIGQTNTTSQTFTLSNPGNQPFVVGFVSGTNTIISSSSKGDFVSGDGCSGTNIGAGGSCTVTIKFAPQAGATGARSGGLVFPITYQGASAATNLTATYTGNAVASSSTLVISPTSLQMGTWVTGTYSDTQTITVTNTSNSPVTLGSFSSAAPFDIQTNCGSTLGAAATCTVTVLYAPTGTGAQTGTIKLPNNSTGAPQSAAVSGTSIAASAQLAFSQGTIAFGSVVEGSTSNAVTLTLVNRSSQAVTVSSVNLGGTNPSDFTVTSNGCSNVTLQGYPPSYASVGYAYSSCSLTVEFSPASGTASTTALTASLTEFDSGSGSGRRASLTGTSTTAAPSVSLFPGSLAFGAQYEKVKSGSQTFSVTNTGSASLTVTTVATSDTTQFPITSNGCNGASLAAGADCLVSVAFDPSSTGAITGTITVTDSASGSPQTLPLSGTGVVPTASVTPTSLTYASQAVGSTSAAQSVTLSNTGTGTLQISSIALGGTDPGDYSLTNPCGSSLTAGASCTLSTTFSPKATGSRTATITITDNSGLVSGATQTVSLTGTGIPVAATPTFTPVAGTYASSQSVTIADTTSGSTIYYTTNGTTPTTSSTQYAGAISVAANETIEAIAVASGYSQSATATAVYTITPPAATPTFTPVGGTYTSSQSVTIADTTSGSTIYYTTNGTTPTTGSTKYVGAITVSATETIEAIAVASGYAQSATGTAAYTIQSSGTTASVSPTSIAFASTKVGSTSGYIPATLTNNGSATLTGIALSITGANASSFFLPSSHQGCGATLAAGASCTFDAAFEPTTGGALTASVQITDSATNSPQTVALSGTGTASVTASVSPTSIAFASTTVGSTSAYIPVTLTNNGTSPLTGVALTITGTNASSFFLPSSHQGCGATLAAGASCTFDAAFEPTTTGALTGSVQITDSATNSPQSVALSGTGK